MSRTLFDCSLVSFSRITLREANEHLVLWGHKMGPLHRGNQGSVCFGLFHREEIVAVTCTSHLISQVVGGGLASLRRENCCELSRLCAQRSGLCRVAIRLWREFVFPSLGFDYAISYQDADAHNGHTYRFDGWVRAAFARSGVDTRSGRVGRNKWVWVWPNLPSQQVTAAPEQPDRGVCPDYKSTTRSFRGRRGDEHGEWVCDNEWHAPEQGKEAKS